MSRKTAGGPSTRLQSCPLLIAGTRRPPIIRSTKIETPSPAPDSACDLPAARWRVYFLRRGLQAHRTLPGPRNPQWRAKEAEYSRRLDRAITEFLRLQSPSALNPPR